MTPGNLNALVVHRKFEIEGKANKTSKMQEGDNHSIIEGKHDDDCLAAAPPLCAHASGFANCH